jgi:hypothetical protein
VTDQLIGHYAHVIASRTSPAVARPVVPIRERRSAS